LNPADQVNRANTYRLEVLIDDGAACADDPYPNNATRETAAVQPDGAHDLVLCPGDEDWFRFNIPAGNTVSFQVAAGAAPVRIALFGPNNNLIAEDGRRIVHQAVVNGVHTLRVRVDAAEAVPYALTVAGASGIDLEVLSVRLSAATAAPGDGLRVETEVTNNRGDTARDVLVRYLWSADALPSADDRLLAEARLPVVEGGAVTRASQRVQVPREALPGPRFVVVDVDPLRALPDLRPNNNRGAASVQIVAACVDDDDRANEGPASATPLDPAEGQRAGVICPFTQDWFRLPVDVAGPVTVRLLIEHARGDLDLRLYDADLNPLGESATESDEEVVSVVLAAPGDLLIQVDGFLDAQNEYTLRWILP
jgi:hypothetical protein